MAEGGDHLYDTEVDLADLRFTYGQIASRIPSGSTVLDVGCAAGKFAMALMHDLACTVVGVDNNPEAIALAVSRGIDVISADLSEEALDSVVGEQRFDVIVLADVLEHLVFPERVLLAARGILKEGGKVLVSFPNVSHVDIGLMLAQDEWRYRPSGLLDDTHLRFYTLSSFVELAFRCGWDTVSVQEVRLPFLHTEVLDYGLEVHIDRARASDLQRIIASVNRNAEVYQYVLELVAAPGRVGIEASESLIRLGSGSARQHEVPLVTILVRSAPGRVAALTAALEAVGRQRDANLEVIVVTIGTEAASADELRLELSKEVGSIISQMVAVPKGPGSFGGAINRGIELAHGRYLAVIDDDDILADDWVSQATNCLTQRQWLSVAVGGWRIVAGAMREGRFELVKDLGRRGGPQSRLELFFGTPIPISSCLMRLEDLKLAEIRADEGSDGPVDWSFLFALMAGHEFQFLPTGAVECRVYEGRLGPSPEDRILPQVEGVPEIAVGLRTQSIRVLGSELVDQRRRQHEVEKDLESCQADLAQAEHTIAQVMASRSWRLTRVLRRLTGSEHR